MMRCMPKDSARPVDSAPVFAVRDIEASLAYYRDALGFDVAFTWGAPTYYAGVCSGSVTIHLQSASQTERPPGTSSLYLFVANADDAYRELVSRGARIVKGPETYPYGMRDFMAVDIDVNILSFVSPEPVTGE
jgi:uncharacterized glyoxalase superfamily protein PhnB